MKKLWFVLLIGISVFTLSACNGDNDEADDVDPDDLRAFTLEELATYDGRDGRDAYIAVDGDVYDVTNSARWQNGTHQGRVQAGQDLTEALDTESTHGREMLDRVPKIGYIVDEHEDDHNEADENMDTSNDADAEDEDDAVYDENGDEPVTDEDDAVYDENGDEPVTDEDENGDSNETEPSLRVFTTEELAQYDGTDGADAYIAVDGYVYDVTNSSRWVDGNHQGAVTAGQDLTDEIDSISPHGRRVLDNVPIIGILDDA